MYVQSTVKGETAKSLVKPLTCSHSCDYKAYGSDVTPPPPPPPNMPQQVVLYLQHTPAGVVWLLMERKIVNRSATGRLLTRSCIPVPAGKREDTDQRGDGPRIHQAGDNNIQSVDVENGTEDHEDKSREFSDAGTRVTLFLSISIA